MSNDIKCYKCGSQTRYMRPVLVLSVSANNENTALLECSDCARGYFFKSINKEYLRMNNNQSPIEFIELGGVYETHDRRKVQCVYIFANSGRAVYIFPENPEAEPMTSDYRGKTYCGERRIIGRWKDKPIVDWSLYSRWYKWVAQNKGGQWYMHQDKPKAAQSCWMSNSGDAFVPKAYAPQFSGDWKDSLCERPE